MSVEVQSLHITKQNKKKQQQKTFFKLFLYNSSRDKFQPCRKIGESQVKGIIYIDIVVLESKILYTNFISNRPSGSGVEYF